MCVQQCSRQLLSLSLFKASLTATPDAPITLSSQSAVLAQPLVENCTIVLHSPTYPRMYTHVMQDRVVVCVCDSQTLSRGCGVGSFGVGCRLSVTAWCCSSRIPLRRESADLGTLGSNVPMYIQYV